MGFVTYGLGVDTPSYPAFSFPLTRVYVGIQGYIVVYKGIQRCTWVYKGIHGYIGVYEGLQRVYRGI